MGNSEIQAAVEKVLGRLFVPLEASGRHVHVTERQANILFGHSLSFSRELSQPGQFLAKERVTVRGPKGEFQNVAVLGPERKEGQVEISLTDGRVLGITPPVRPSGSVAGSPGITILGPEGSVELSQGVICAQRHIHMTPEDAAQWGVTDGQIVKLKCFTDRPTVFEELLVRVSPKFATYVHLDYDEANACGFQNGDLGRLIL